MIKYERHILGNGLRIIIHEDPSTPLAAINILYNAGSKDEDPGATGLAHLFEHLMFGGTPQVPDFDTPLQLAGGESNAFTGSDITNYYLTVPAVNIETGFWLESDRMKELDFSERNLEVQKKVVAEEFRQRYLNQPYGDAMHKLLRLAYKTHPYRWPAIGMKISHIDDTDLNRVRDFYYSYYAPNNAIAVIAGNIKSEKVLKLAENWFAPIPSRHLGKKKAIPEKTQTRSRQLVISGDVPSDAVYKAWHSCERVHPDFNVLDMITDILAGGDSGRLYNQLVKKKRIFSDINAYLTPDIEPGLVIIQGKLMEGITLPEADRAIEDTLNELCDKHITHREIEKIRNKSEASVMLSNTSVLNKAINLAFYELLGNTELINHEATRFREIDRNMIRRTACTYLDPKNCSTIYYSRSGKELQ